MRTCVQTNTNTYSNFIHNSPKPETIQMPVYRWRDKKLWFVHSVEYYFAIKMEAILDTQNNMVESQNIMLSKRSKRLYDVHVCEILEAKLI